jgi:hypothetical protein
MIGDELYDMICSTITKLITNSTILEYNSDNNHELICITYELDNNVTNATTLPKYRLIKKEDKLIQNNEVCAICLNNYKTNEYKRELNKCNHIFHKKCIDKWFKNSDNKSCPLCRINYN